MSESNKVIRDWVFNRFTGQGGALWELGAFDGVNDSITRPLLTQAPIHQEAPWRGLLVEGNCKNALKLLSSYPNHSHVEVLHAVLSSDDGVATWWDDDNDQESTLVAAHANDAVNRPRSDGWARKYFTRLVATLSYQSLFDWWMQCNRPMPRLIVADLEGVSMEAALTLVYIGCRPEVFVVENDAPFDLPHYRLDHSVFPDHVFVKL